MGCLTPGVFTANDGGQASPAIATCRASSRCGDPNHRKTHPDLFQLCAVPSTLVHLGLAGLIAAGLLGTAYDRRALLVVFAATAFPDLDSFASLVSTVGHRTVLHTFVVPLLAGLALWADTHVRHHSFVRSRWGARGVRVGWVAVLCYAVAGVGVDLFTGGANMFWPLHDQLYVIDGKIELSSQRGIVQTFLQPATEGGAPTPRALGNSSEVVMSSGVDPPEGSTDHVFPVVRSGWQLLIVVAGAVVTAGRFVVPHEVGGEE